MVFCRLTTHQPTIKPSGHQTIQTIYHFFEAMDNRDVLLLERFFDRSISPEERAELDRRLASDADFAAQFDWQKRLGKAFRAADAKAMKARLQEEEQKFNPVAMKVSWFNSGRLMAIAACLVAVVAAIGFLWPKPADAEKLFAANYSGFPNLYKDYGSRGESPVQEENFKTGMGKALNPLDSSDYEATLKMLMKIVPENADQKAAQGFYVGYCHLALKNYTAAAAAFLPVSESGNSQYEAPAIFYLGLTKIAQKDLEGAKKTLTKLKDNYPETKLERQKAMKLLEQM